MQLYPASEDRTMVMDVCYDNSSSRSRIKKRIKEKHEKIKDKNKESKKSEYRRYIYEYMLDKGLVSEEVRKNYYENNSLVPVGRSANGSKSMKNPIRYENNSSEENNEEFEDSWRECQPLYNDDGNGYTGSYIEQYDGGDYGRNGYD